MAESDTSAPTVSEERLQLLYWSDVSALSNEELSAGLPEDEYLRRAAAVTKLELFMNTMDHPEHLEDFPNLVELAIHLETYPRALHLVDMRQLQRLCLTETGLTELAGIENCAALTHLDCSHNKISELDGRVLRRLPRLRQLWMNDNAIEQMQGLSALTSLTSLWLAANRIPAICDALTHNTSLEELNLAGNLISNFKDVPNLARMRKLTTLSLSDPHFGENPVCSLCNYQTYVLFHMSQLSKFDANVISDELRQLAEATYMKKKMYYNMRIKTLKRNTSNVIRKAMEARQTKVSQINLNLNVLLRQAKDVERELHLLGLEPPPASNPPPSAVSSQASPSKACPTKGARGAPTADEMDALRRKERVLASSIDSKTMEIETVEARAAALKALVCDTSQTSICRLLVELETGGTDRTLTLTLTLSPSP